MQLDRGDNIRRLGLRRRIPLVLQITVFVVLMLFVRIWSGTGIVFCFFQAIRPAPGLHTRCKASDSCWPSIGEWESFNSSIGGRLIRTYPSAAACHAQEYSKELCVEAKDHWADSFWRTSQPGAYSAIIWELGDDQCFINATIDAPCGQGRVAQYSANVSEVEHVQKAIRFAHENNLYIVVKNTGHDHLGRSSGEGSFAIWTHNLKGREWHQSFIPSAAPEGTQGVAAVTLQAGEQWLDVYTDAAAHNVTVVGGSARTVGAAGGYLTGGGHSPFAHFYGLAADNLLEAQVIAPNGTLLILSPYTDPDYFWALRGGGGNAWGVIISVTYRTHPLPSAIQAVLVLANATSNSTLRTLYERVLPLIPDVAAAGYTGYADLTGQLAFIFLQPNATNETFEATFAPFQDLQGIEGTQVFVAPPILFETWLDYGTYFLKDPNIATNVQDASRLLTPYVLKNKTKELVDLIFDFPELGSGFNFIGAVNPARRGETSVHPVWRESVGMFSMGGDWADDASGAKKRHVRRLLVDASLRLEAIVGPEGGTYVNEANPYEPHWQQVFWGSNYKKLAKIKRRIDPSSLFVCNRCVGTDIVLQP